MMARIVRAIVLIPLAIVIVAFALANRQAVQVSFDPFDAADPAYALRLPLFALILLLLVFGVLIGGAAAWLRQSRWRRAARQSDAEVTRLRLELDAYRAQTAADASAGSAPSRDRLIIPPPAA